MKKTNPIHVVCDNIRSLYNVGAIFRTSDATNIRKIYLCGITGYPKENDSTWFQTKKISKTALGANKTVPWEYIDSCKSTVESLKSKGVKIYVLENTLASFSYSATTYAFPCALVLGHEVTGVNDKIINIPMYDAKTSLNVEVAYAVAIYEMINHL